MSWDFPPEPAGGAGPYYEFPPGPGYPFASGPSTPLRLASPASAAAPQATPLPLREAIKQLPRQYRKVLTKPGAATFAEEAGKAEWGIIWVQLLGYAAIGAILGLLAWLVLIAFWGFLFNSLAASSPDSGSFPLPSFFLLPGLGIGILIFLGIFIGSIASFFIGEGITYLLAKAFGGQGSFTTQMYTTLLFQVPIGLLSSLIALIPYVGGLAGSAGSIYGLVLQVFSLMAVHRLSVGKAIAVVLIPIAASFLLVIGFYILLLVFLFSAHNIFVPSQ
jgi:hypothetical protein